LDGVCAGLGEFILVAHTSGRPLQFRCNCTLKIAVLGPNINNERMTIVIARDEFSFFLREASVCRTKGSKLRRVGQIRQALNITTLLQYGVEKINASLFMRDLGSRFHQLCIEFRELLLT